MATHSTKTDSEKDQENSGRKAAPCPTCGGAVDPESTQGPFCSSRCKMADLGAWFKGNYVISREIKDTDLDEGP